MDKMFSTDAIAHEGPSSSTQVHSVKKEEPEDDFTFDEPAHKKLKTTSAPQGKVVKLKSADNLRDELQMNWDPVQVRAYKSILLFIIFRFLLIKCQAFTDNLL